MPRATRQISPTHKQKVILLHSIGPAVFALIAWILFAVVAIFHVDPIRSHTRNQSGHPDSTFYLIMAVSGTIGAAAFAIWQVNRALDLAKRGAEVVGKVSSVARVAVKGFVQVQCKYIHRNKQYTHSWSEPNGGEIPAVGDDVMLIVDRHKPEKCIRASELFLS